MHARSFRFDSAHLNAFFSPRKPRTPWLRALLGLVGLVLLAMLVFFGVFVGAAMLAVGLAWRMLRRSPARTSTPSQVVDAEYRVVRKSELPAPR